MKSSGAFKPFQHLKHLIKSKSIELRSASPDYPPAAPVSKPDTADENRLFAEAMADVTPLAATDPVEKPAAAAGQPLAGDAFDQEVFSHLQKLLDCGEGYDVASTSEYLEGVGYQTHPAVTRYLHRGLFSIESHIDLHGYNVSLAREKFDHFIDTAIKSGKRMVLVVHGRGLSSPQQPVLKSMVRQWLTTGTWRKWVIAFASARPCDGGAGATYVLLRSRPLTKRFKKGGGRQS